FVTLRDGLQTLVERLYDCLSVWANLEAEQSVLRIERTPATPFAEARVSSEEATGPASAVRASGHARYRLAVAAAESGTAAAAVRWLDADAVIVATPGPVAAQLLQSVCPAAQTLADIRQVSTATIILGYDSARITTNLTASGFVVPRLEQRGITACTWLTSKWPHTSRHGVVMLRCYVGRDGQEEGLELSDAELVRMVQRELDDILGLRATPLFTRVTRWPEAMPQYDVGHLQRLATVEQALSQQAPGVVLAGASYRGVGIPDCIRDGQRAAEAVWLHLQQH
ncbi:MAG: protoporphyrinogen oxidase, partial [Alicyclobacillus sp.]|nr:protoporphyrinogen oxidase [Alicyclobacillus sp.]